MHERSEGRRTATAAAQQVEQFRENWDEVDTRLRKLVHERPLASLLVALVAGYVVARVASRI